MKIKRGISHIEIDDMVDWSYKYFKKLISKRDFHDIISTETNWDISAKLVDDDNKLMGLYLLGDKQIGSLVKNEKAKKYLTLNGIEGVLLAVDKDIQGQGWGNKLKDYPKTLGFDYIWGQQLKTLDNLKDWLKRRVLIAQTRDVYITLEDFKK